MDSPAPGTQLRAYQAAVASLPFGKILPTAVYVFDGVDFPLPETLRTIADRLRERLALGPEFNLLKWGTRELKLSFLSYPTFQEEAHPALSEAVSVDLASGKVRRTRYAGRANPPILHRKETFLPKTASVSASSASTKACSAPTTRERPAARSSNPRLSRSG